MLPSMMFHPLRQPGATAPNPLVLAESRHPFVDDVGVVDGRVELSGDPEHGIWTAGMVQGLIHDVPTVKQLVDRIVAEAEAIIDYRLARLVGRTEAAAA